MNKIKYLVFTLLICIMGIFTVSAASISVKTNKSSYSVGDTITVTTTVSGSDAATWEYCITYDSSKVTLKSSRCVNAGSAYYGVYSQTFTFKASTSGNATFGITDANVSNDDGEYVSVSKGSKTVSIGSTNIINKDNSTSNIEDDTTYSDNANLKLLEVVNYEISPEFNSDTTEYTLTVPSDVDTIQVNAYKEDNTATISTNVEDIDNIKLTDGVNKVEITVVAAKGNKKVYTIEVTKEEENPIEVSVDGNTYILQKGISENIKVSSNYQKSTIEIDDNKVDCYINDVTNITLVALKDNTGNIKLYKYENGTYSKYTELNGNSITIIPISTDEVISGYNEKEMEINDENVKVLDNGSEYVLVYGMNASTGDTGWYKYDTKEGTIQRYEEVESNDLYKLLTGLFVVVAAISIILVIILSSINSNLREKNSKLIARLKGEDTKIDKKADDKDVSEESSKETKEEVDEEVRFKASKKNSGKSKKTLSPEEELEKTKKLEEIAELKAMREDFFSTDEIKVGDLEEKPKKSKKKKK